MATDTSKYKLNHSMIRVKDPKASVRFYEILGMKLINKIENPDAKFDLYFLAYDTPRAVSHGNHWTDREGLIELTHNYGTENDPNYKITNGNKDPYRGIWAYLHLCGQPASCLQAIGGCWRQVPEEAIGGQDA